MPHKYSHALVLSHYESRGLISFPHSHPHRHRHRHRHTPQTPQSPPHVEPDNSEGKPHRLPPTAEIPSSPPRTPLPPLPPLLPLTTGDEDLVLSSHRSTPSIITEIYAPESSAESLDSTALHSDSKPQDAQISPTTTEGTTSLTSEVSSRGEETPRTSVSSVRLLTRQDGETRRDKVSGFTFLTRFNGS